MRRLGGSLRPTYMGHAVVSGLPGFRYGDAARAAQCSGTWRCAAGPARNHGRPLPQWGPRTSVCAWDHRVPPRRYADGSRLRFDTDTPVPARKPVSQAGTALGSSLVRPSARQSGRLRLRAASRRSGPPPLRPQLHNRPLYDLPPRRVPAASPARPMAPESAARSSSYNAELCSPGAPLPPRSTPHLSRQMRADFPMRGRLVEASSFSDRGSGTSRSGHGWVGSVSLPP